jgi:hypothetical protein
MREYRPDCWVLVRVTHPDGKKEKRVFGGWLGGYLAGDSWRMSTNITHLKTNKKTTEFTCESGSKYICQNDAHHCSAHMHEVLASLSKHNNIKLIKEPNETTKK